MKVVKIVCPECGEEVIFDNSKQRKFIYCNYCKSKIHINYNAESREILSSNQQHISNEDTKEFHMHKASLPIKSIETTDWNSILNTVILVFSFAIVVVLAYVFIIINKPL